MEAVIEWSSFLALAGAVSVLGGAWLTIRKLNSDYKKERDAESAKILQSAKEEVAKLKIEWNSEKSLRTAETNGKIELVQNDLDGFKESVSKDFAHVRETYNGEIRNLGTKIEELRSELRNQHGQLVGLLTKMIDNRD